LKHVELEQKKLQDTTLNGSDCVFLKQKL